MDIICMIYFPEIKRKIYKRGSKNLYSLQIVKKIKIGKSKICQRVSSEVKINAIKEKGKTI